MFELSESSPSPAAQPTSKSSRRYTDSFKQDALRLISQEGCSFAVAAHATGMSEKSLREWHKEAVVSASGILW